MIEKILKSRGQWAEAELAQAEAWKRERRARGPPRELEILTQEVDEFSQVAQHSVDEFCQLPPGADADF